MERRVEDLEAEMDAVKRAQALQQVQIGKLAQLATSHTRRLDAHDVETREFRQFMHTFLGQMSLLKWLVTVVPGLAVVLASVLVWTILHVGK